LLPGAQARRVLGIFTLLPVAAVLADLEPQPVKLWRFNRIPLLLAEAVLGNLVGFKAVLEQTQHLMG
jgi:hypothetical protein